ncbi:hypothetical protein [Martelella alba]|uniref:Uncharacterized protein n=1 Tax=Martelella alba TaxID=2590451 RepID=A0ABY2SGA3_9HYPH|nr:hypothetical protein [Martelella alba]TKI04121.1 hypothetical protein FCN80_19355 [Martelella alba]
MMYSIQKEKVTDAINSVIAMAKRHITRNGVIYRFVELHLNKRIYGFGEKSVYAYADAINLQYMFPFANILPDINASLDYLAHLQDTNSQLYYEGSHHILHTTASAVACLARWHQRPTYDCSYIIREFDITKSLNSIRWDIEPWRDSNIPSALRLLVNVYFEQHEKEFFANKFYNWLYENACPKTGLWRKGHISDSPNRGIFPSIASGFHFLIHYQFDKVKFPHNRQLRQTCFNYYNNQYIKLFESLGYIDIDFLYCLLRSWSQSHQELEDNEISVLHDMFRFFCEMILKQRYFQHSTD